jgi:hypothetical protein
MTDEGDDLRDILGRRRSPATMPGKKRKMPPANAGETMPSDPVTPSEVRGVFANYPKSKTGRRDRAMAWLVYRFQIRPHQVVALRMHHYRPDQSELRIPKSGTPLKSVTLDPTTRQIIEEWLVGRETLKLSSIAPLFCTASHSHGREVDRQTIQTSFAKAAQRAGIDRWVGTEGLRKSWADGRATLAQHVAGQIAADLDDDRFRSAYPKAYDKWLSAQGLFERDAIAHSQTIGYECRDALAEFADALVAITGAAVEKRAGTKDKLRAVLLASKSEMSSTVHDHLVVLIRYWGSVYELANRQGHNARREEDRLTPEDARRVIFQTMVVMYEVDNALRTLLP